jgi:hypothetical protein
LTLDICEIPCKLRLEGVNVSKDWLVLPLFSLRLVDLNWQTQFLGITYFRAFLVCHEEIDTFRWHCLRRGSDLNSKMSAKVAWPMFAYQKQKVD